MSGFSFSKLKQAKPSMRRRLFLYMGALAALLLVTLFAVLLLLGQLKSPREELAKSLTFRMEAFQSDMESLWRNVSVMGLHLSEDMTAILEKQTTDLSKLDGDADAVERLEEAMLEPLCQYVRQADCSGAFVVLNTSLVSADSSFSGLYVQRSNAAHTTSGLLLYRGMADIGRRHDVMPHRKWAQEFDLSEFPGFAEHLKTASVPIERDCRTTSLLTLLDTSERAILLTVPMLGGDGTAYGLCGFSVNQTYFSSHHAQPSGVSRLACVLSDSVRRGWIFRKGLLAYPADGFCFVPDELLTKKNLQGGTHGFYTGTELSFVGLSRPFMAASGDIEPHALTVLIPKRDYGRLLLKSKLEIGGLLMLLVFFGVSLLSVLHATLFQAHSGRHRSCHRRSAVMRDSPFFEELLPTFRPNSVTTNRPLPIWKQKNRIYRGQMEQVEANAKHLAQKRKDEIDPRGISAVPVCLSEAGT